MSADTMNCWTLTSPGWHAAVKQVRSEWAAMRAYSGEVEVPEWVHDIGLVLRGRYTGAKQRERVWGTYLRAMVEHEQAARAAYRMGGPVAAVKVLNELGFGSAQLWLTTAP